MSFRIDYSVTVTFVGDGMGPMELPGSPAISFFGSGLGAAPLGIPGQGGQLVPGGNTPTAANFTTALNSMAADIAAQIAVPATLARVQAFATGGG